MGAKQLCEDIEQCSKYHTVSTPAQFRVPNDVVRCWAPTQGYFYAPAVQGGGGVSVTCAAAALLSGRTVTRRHDACGGTDC